MGTHALLLRSSFGVTGRHGHGQPLFSLHNRLRDDVVMRDVEPMDAGLAPEPRELAAYEPVRGQLGGLDGVVEGADSTQVLAELAVAQARECGQIGAIAA